MFYILMILLANQLQNGYSRKYIIDSNFIEPLSISSHVDQFVIGEKEYLFVNAKMSFIQAMLLCKEIYNADLAFVKNSTTLGKFLAEALSETNLIMDSLWIAAVQEKDPGRRWWWIRDNRTEPVDQSIIRNLHYNRRIIANDRKCIAFSRNDHDLPDYRELVCRARRAVMCERPRGGSGNKNSTHPGWIKIGRRYYKIFQDLVTWEMASEKCFQHDPDSMLAVVITFEDAQQLGRYLLIGRPSLENAWMGANWIHGRYTFVEEDMILSNHSDSSYYPPWRNRKMKKPGGCLLLDRHLANVTLFVEAQCQRERPYICYKFAENETDQHSDVIIDNDGYRLEFLQRNWAKARNYCKDVYQNYSSTLVEIRELKQKFHLLYVMGENKTAVGHIWIGGRRNNETWVWDTDNAEINTGSDSLLNWVRNISYNHEAERDNLCLGMDRENHIVALHYGTICRYEQHFVCHFTADNLRRLQEDEEKKRLDDNDF